MGNKDLLEIIERGTLENSELTKEEKELATKILLLLRGKLVIRANSILKFCLKAIEYTEI